MIRMVLFDDETIPILERFLDYLGLDLWVDPETQSMTVSKKKELDFRAPEFVRRIHDRNEQRAS